MADRVRIRPTRRRYAVVVFLSMWVAFVVFIIVRGWLLDPAQIHCTQTTCWFRIDSPIGVDTTSYAVRDLHGSRVKDTTVGKKWIVDASDDVVELGEETDNKEQIRRYDELAPRLGAFLDAPTSAGFDATYASVGNYVLTYGWTLFMCAVILVYLVRGWAAEITIDRATEELVVRRGPLMFSGREQRRSLQAFAAFELRNPWHIYAQRVLVIHDGLRVPIQLRAPGKREYAGEINAMLEQPA